MSRYIEFTHQDQLRYYATLKYGRLHRPLKSLYYGYKRLIGRFSPEDQLRMACMCEPPMFFLRHGLMIPHAYGITLSVDEIGADCCLGHNITLGTNRKNMPVEEGYSDGYKPRVGHLVNFYTNSVVSGEVTIGDCVIVAAQAFVDRDVPPLSFVYGHNQIKPLGNHHIRYLQSVLYLCIHEYKLIPGLMYREGNLYIDTEYAAKRSSMMERLEAAKK
jgi:serine acetyltransferase